MTDRTFLPSDEDVIEAARDALLERTVTAFGEAITEAMVEGYKLGFGHGVRSMAAADPVFPGLIDVIRRSHDVPRPQPDVRPHVPYADPFADPRLHLIADGQTACGIKVGLDHGPTRKGTHNPAEADCPECIAALQRVGDEAGLPTDGQISDLVKRAAAGAETGDLRAAEELARAAHPSAFPADAPSDMSTIVTRSWPASAGNRPTDLRSGEDVPAAIARTEASHVQQRVTPDRNEAPTLPPRGWDKIEGGEEVSVDTVVCRSLHGELIDITSGVVAYAHGHKLRWWQCRHCGRGRVMGTVQSITAHDEWAEAGGHEQDCDHKGAAVDA